MAIPSHLRHNFEVLCEACDDGNIGILEAKRASNGTLAYLLVVRSGENIIPLAEFFLDPNDAFTLFKPDGLIEVQQNAPSTETTQ